MEKSTRLVVGRIHVPQNVNLANTYFLPLSCGCVDARMRLRKEISDLAANVFQNDWTARIGFDSESCDFVSVSVRGIENEALVLGCVVYDRIKKSQPTGIDVITFANPTANGKIIDYFEGRKIYPIF